MVATGAVVVATGAVVEATGAVVAAAEDDGARGAAEEETTEAGGEAMEEDWVGTDFSSYLLNLLLSFSSHFSSHFPPPFLLSSTPLLSCPPSSVPGYLELELWVGPGVMLV